MYAKSAAFDDKCKEVLGQIRDRNYEGLLIDDGMKVIYRYWYRMLRNIEGDKNVL